MLLGSAIAWYLGVKGEDPATMRGQLFAFFHIQDPGTVLPGGANPIPAFAGVNPITAAAGNPRPFGQAGGPQ
jgi:hypothetical protein